MGEAGALGGRHPLGPGDRAAPGDGLGTARAPPRLRHAAAAARLGDRRLQRRAAAAPRAPLRDRALRRGGSAAAARAPRRAPAVHLLADLPARAAELRRRPLPDRQQRRLPRRRLPRARLDARDRRAPRAGAPPHDPRADARRPATAPPTSTRSATAAGAAAGSSPSAASTPAPASTSGATRSSSAPSTRASASWCTARRAAGASSPAARGRRCTPCRSPGAAAAGKRRRAGRERPRRPARPPRPPAGRPAHRRLRLHDPRQAPRRGAPRLRAPRGAPPAGLLPRRRRGLQGLRRPRPRPRGLRPRVLIAGRPDLADFLGYMAAADLAINLRYPGAGETSATLIRLLGMGKPVVVTDAGAFAELPAGSVAKVPPDESEEDLLPAYLDALAADPVLRHAIGEAARRHVERHHRVEQTAAAYAAAIEAILAAGPRPVPAVPPLAPTRRGRPLRPDRRSHRRRRRPGRGRRGRRPPARARGRSSGHGSRVGHRPL